MTLKAIAEALETNTTLTTLDLSHWKDFRTKSYEYYAKIRTLLSRNLKMQTTMPTQSSSLIINEKITQPPNLFQATETEILQLTTTTSLPTTSNSNDNARITKTADLEPDSLSPAPFQQINNKEQKLKGTNEEYSPPSTKSYKNNPFSQQQVIKEQEEQPPQQLEFALIRKAKASSSQADKLKNSRNDINTFVRENVAVAAATVKSTTVTSVPISQSQSSDDSDWEDEETPRPFPVALPVVTSVPISQSQSSGDSDWEDEDEDEEMQRPAAKNAEGGNKINTSSSTLDDSRAKTQQSQASNAHAIQFINSLLLENPELRNNLQLIAELPAAVITTLQDLGRQKINLNDIILSSSHLMQNYGKFEDRLLNIEKLNELDAQSQTEISDIRQDKSLRIYYKTLKILLGQTFLAAHVISSGAVDPTPSMQMTVLNGIASVAGSLCPPAAPFLSFACMLAGAADNISSCKAMHNLSSWADFQTMAIFASLLARRFTQIQKGRPAQESSAQDKKWLEKFAQECEALFQAIQNGQPLTPEKQHATLVAKKILDYMKQNARPENSTPDECVTILLRVIMGANYVHDSGHTVTTVQQSSVTTVTVTASVATTTTVASQHDVELLHQKMVAMQATLEAEKQSKYEQEQRLKTMQQQMQELKDSRKQTSQPNPSSSQTQDNGDGTISFNQQEHMVNTPYGPMPLSTFLLFKDMQTKIVNLEGGLGTTNQVVVSLQEQQNNGIKNNNTRDQQLRQNSYQGGSSASYQQQKK